MGNHHRSARRKLALLQERAEAAERKAREAREDAEAKAKADNREAHRDFYNLEWSSTNYERGGIAVTGSTYSALLKTSSYVKRGKPRIRMDNRWAEMGGKFFCPYGSTELSHGPKVRHNGSVEARNIVEIHKYWEV